MLPAIAAAAALLASSPGDVLPDGPTYVFRTGFQTPFAVPVPGTDFALVARSTAAVPAGEQLPLPLNATLPKYLMEVHSAEEAAALRRAYGADVVGVDAADRFFVLATAEVEERKAHGCGALVLKPAGSSTLRPLSAVEPQCPLGVDTAAKKAAMERLKASTLERRLRELSGEDPVKIDGASVHIPTRYSFVDWNLKVAHWAGDLLTATAGCDEVIYQDFSATFRKTRNVICVRKGSEDPHKIVVLGAHFDSISSANGGDSKKIAPGAIDNGSGSATVLAAAEALREMKPKQTVHFVLFSGEEQGLYGSTHYVDELVKAGHQENVTAALIMDMTAFSSQYFGVIIEGTKDKAVKAVMENAQQNLDFLKKHLGSRMTIEHHTISFGSDHVPFQRAGIPAVLHIEQDDTDYFGYHKTTDVVANANFDQMRDIGRVILGQVVDYAY